MIDLDLMANLETINRFFGKKISLKDLKKPSVIVLLAANIAPLIEVIFFGWETFILLLLFWIENVIVGIINVLKMLTASSRGPDKHTAKRAVIPFFCIHYGIFTFVHGIFVFVVFGSMITGDGPFPSFSSLRELIGRSQLTWAVLALFASHLISYFHNYLGKGEYKTTSLNELMAQPYGSVVLLHITIIFGGFLVMMLGSPVFGLVLLIGLKIYVDVMAHLKQHSIFDTSTAKAQMPQDESL